MGEALARRFHEAYERLAPQYGYETRADTKAFDPNSANGRLMIAVCSEVMTPPQDGVSDVERLRAAEAEVERLRAVLVRICEEDRYTTRRRTNLNGGLRGHAGMIAAFALTGKNGSYLTDADVREHVAALAVPINKIGEDAK